MRERELTELVDGRESSSEESEGEQKKRACEARRDIISTNELFHSGGRNRSIL